MLPMSPAYAKSSEFRVLYPIYILVYTIDSLTVADSPLIIFLYWSISAAKYFPFKDFKGHFHLLRYCPSFTCIAQDPSHMVLYILC